MRGNFSYVLLTCRGASELMRQLLSRLRNKSYLRS